MNYAELNTQSGISNQTPLRFLSVKPNGHYMWALGKVTFMPSSVSQAIKHVRHINANGYDNLLMCGEWHNVEEFLNKHGIKGDYKITKSGTMCRLENVSDYVTAIKKEFSI